MRPRHLTTAALVATLLTLTAACANATKSNEAAKQATDPETLGHVHGLGTDPADGIVYAASHFGVFSLGKDGVGPAERVADRWQDTMAFTVVGPNHFLASGHPDQRENLPVHLGLIESTDAAQTWEPVALQGDADFHALEAAGDLLYGYDSVSGSLVVTSDTKAWRTLDQVQVADLAADPRDPTRVLAATPDGLVAYGADGDSAAITDAPPLMFLDWPTVDLLLGVTGDGIVYRSRDGGNTWERADGPPGAVQALEVGAANWLIATDSGLYESVDDGRSWQPLTTR